MSSIRQAVYPGKRKQDVRRAVPDGKENARPKKITAKDLSKDPSKDPEPVPRKRLTLTASEPINHGSSRILEISARKPRFRIHCDEKLANEVQSKVTKRSSDVAEDESNPFRELFKGPARSNVTLRTKIPLRVDRVRSTEKVTDGKVLSGAKNVPDKGKNEREIRNGSSETRAPLQTRNERIRTMRGKSVCSVPMRVEASTTVPIRSQSVSFARRPSLKRNEETAKTSKRIRELIANSTRKEITRSSQAERPVKRREELTEKEKPIKEEKEKPIKEEQEPIKKKEVKEKEGSIKEEPIKESEDPTSSKEKPTTSGETEETAIKTGESKIPRLQSLKSTSREKPEVASNPAETSAAKKRPPLLRSFRIDFQENLQVNVITPVDGAPPAPQPPVKALVRQAKQEAAERKTKSESESIELFPSALTFHLEYQDDLPVVEWEREERSPGLSDDFLRWNINERQRSQIVVYLIHLSSHCRYPSYVVYQAVKLFDVVMDRIPVETFYLQLTALAALWICLKRQENYHKIPSAATMTALARELYLGREDLLISYERKILQALDFNVTFPDAFTIFAHCMTNCKERVEIPDKMSAFLFNCGGYLIDLTLLDERLCRVSTSLVAIVAAELALGFADLISGQPQPRWRLWRALSTAGSPLHRSFREEEITGLRDVMISAVQTSGGRRSGYEVVYKKYNRSRYGRISDKVVQCALRVTDSAQL